MRMIDKQCAAKLYIVIRGVGNEVARHGHCKYSALEALQVSRFAREDKGEVGPWCAPPRSLASACWLPIPGLGFVDCRLISHGTNRPTIVQVLVRLLWYRQFTLFDSHYVDGRRFVDVEQQK